MLVFLEASHFPWLGLIDFLLIILLISGNGGNCRGFDYFRSSLFPPELFPYFVNYLASIVCVLVLVVLG